MISGSEVAFFSLSVANKKDLSESNNINSLRIIQLLENPKKLLATILIANNFINVAIVMLSTVIVEKSFDNNELSGYAQFFIQVIAVTFIILLFGEVIPKIYANKFNLKFSRIMALPLSFISIIFKPISSVLVSSTSIIDKRYKKKTNSISVDELEHALDLTKDSVEDEDEKKLLEGIVKFGNTDAKQIMTPRTDVNTLDFESKFDDILKTIFETRFSRLPVFQETLDNIKGILYVKDLLPHIESGNDFQWKDLIRNPKFIPENKKLDDLLKEFQEEKKHIAIIVDEYGGTSGIVTLEDVLEEIVGDITDEFDQEDLAYSKLDENNFVFEGKTSLMDMYRIMDISGDIFEEAKGESDTIAGFCIEQAGKILLKNEKIQFHNLLFTVEAADKRKIKQVKVSYIKNQDDNQKK
ncbi:MAG: magnesium/cobalt efflux protein [Crocinitomicaceae bacterium]|nr:magnesium/cobalt efflux protein [Crocinitomicaceae bacterium]